MFATQAIHKINLTTATRDELKSAIKAYRLDYPDCMTPDLRKCDDALKAFILSERRSVKFVTRFLGYVRDSWKVVDDMSRLHGVAAYDILWSINTLRVDSSVERFILDMHEDAILALIDAVVSLGLTGDDVARYLNTRFSRGIDQGDSESDEVITEEDLNSSFFAHELSFNAFLWHAYNGDMGTNDAQSCLGQAVADLKHLIEVYYALPKTIEFQSQNRVRIGQIQRTLNVDDEIELLKPILPAKHWRKVVKAFAS